MMLSKPIPVLSDLVLIGGGHAHALVARMWGMAPMAGVRLTLINPGPAAPYTGMLPGHIAGHYTREEIMIDLVRLARFAGARVILDRVVGIDRDTRQVLFQDRPPIFYDVASIDIGIASDLPDVAGFAEHAAAAKPLGAYAERWEAFVARALPSPRVVVVGGGIGGVELALASHTRLSAAGAQPEISVVQRGETALPGLGAGARRALLARLSRAGIRLILGAEPLRIASDQVALSNGQTLAADFILAVAGAQPQRWLGDTGLELHNGFVSVSRTLQSSDARIFAVGDCAHLAFAPRPKAGVFAVRAAPVLYANLRAALSGGAMQRFKPQSDYLKLISTGTREAVADKWGLPLHGAWLWRLKDRIDRKFMAKFATYPAMPTPALPHPAPAGLAEAMAARPMCGGCGAKLAAGDLDAALANLAAPRRADVLSGPGDDAAVLVHGRQVQVITTDHLRGFWGDARLMARIAAVHALGDVWAMGANPQVALAQVVLPAMGQRQSREMLDEIMQAAAEVFTAAGADVVGGHTSVGAELTIGFTVTGLATRAIAKGGAQVGDALILTKPIGSGTMMAAEMANRHFPGMILGEAVAKALALMARPNDAAAAVLAPVAHAMTDVTGFGLAGHLLEMLEASGVAAALQDVPLMAGARALAAAGEASSLAPANRAATLSRVNCAHDPALLALLHDPQTGGGLLAAVPGDQAEAVLAALLAQGEAAAIIGNIVDGTPAVTVL